MRLNGKTTEFIYLCNAIDFVIKGQKPYDLFTTDVKRLIRNIFLLFTNVIFIVIVYVNVIYT